jgi:hypothetical protein
MIMKPVTMATGRRPQEADSDDRGRVSRMVRIPRLARPDTPEPDDRWARAVDRLDRAVRRYHVKVAATRDRRLRTELQQLGELLTRSMTEVVAAGQRPAVREGRDDVALRAVVRAATLTAHATEAAMTADDAQRHGESNDVGRYTDSARTLVKAVHELIDACAPPGRR